MPYLQLLFTFSEVGNGGGCRIEASGGKGDKHPGNDRQPCLRRQCVQSPVQFFPENGSAFSPSEYSSFPYAYLSMLLMSLFSSIVNPSMVNPFGLSSERLAFSSRQVVTSVRSVTLLSLMIICLA